ncbi:MAG: 3-ketoacyl-ACP reductase [Deltaproteobacteria bacterium]|nr:MAG: 3-ketoacyl-ACP reductase [Deltaproteobacteria bacterium]
MDRRCALVTGSTRGIGKAIAIALAQERINVVLNGRSPKENVEKTIHECRSKGVDVDYIQCDISNAQSRELLVQNIKRKFGRLDILINNAGVPPLERRDILRADEKSFDYVLSINLKAPFFLTQIVSRWMIEQKQEHPERSMFIVNISSISAYAASIERGEYCISKAGLTMVTKLFAVRLAPYGINVYEVRPGIILTDMTAPVKDKYDALIDGGLTPIKRWGRPEDVAQAIVAIARGNLPFSTGEVINVDGGFHLRSL